MQRFPYSSAAFIARYFHGPSTITSIFILSNAIPPTLMDPRRARRPCPVRRRLRVCVVVPAKRREKRRARSLGSRLRGRVRSVDGTAQSYCGVGVRAACACGSAAIRRTARSAGAERGSTEADQRFARPRSRRSSCSANWCADSAPCCGRNDILARLAGDEFTILARDARDAGDAEAVIQKMLQMLRDPLTYGRGKSISR